MQDAHHDTPLDLEHNEPRALLNQAHAFALEMTLAALARGEDAAPLSEEDFLLATLPPAPGEREESTRIVRNPHAWEA